MNEIEIYNSIKNIIGSEFIGDDCAYLKNEGIVITQDTLVENIHFKRDWIKPRQLGYKSAAVNISDILASGAKPVYMTVSLSLPNNINENFVNEFYNGVLSASNDTKIVGGDITGSKNDIIISICAIGSTKNRNISSRKNAKNGYIIITTGEYGSSAKGLESLINGDINNVFVKNHLEPVLNPNFSEYISTKVKEPYAMMDTSDGLLDALYKIAEASNVTIDIDYNKIPHNSEISYDMVLFGGEDYNLVAAIPEYYAKNVPDSVIIGCVKQFDGIRVNISGEKFDNYNQLKVYNHFGE